MLIGILAILILCLGIVKIHQYLATKQLQTQEQAIEPIYVDEAHRVVSTYSGLPGGDIKKLIVILRCDGTIEHIETKILKQDEKICIDSDEEY